MKKASDNRHKRLIIFVMITLIGFTLQSVYRYSVDLEFSYVELAIHSVINIGIGYLLALNNRVWNPMPPRISDFDRRESERIMDELREHISIAEQLIKKKQE